MKRTALVAFLGLVLCSSAPAAWSSGNAGPGKTAAKTLPGGNAPSGSVSGRSVTLTWTASAFAGGGAVPGYVVRRFNSTTGSEATVLSACSGIVATNSCAESNVPTGTWRYTVTPAAGIWRGTQSAQSASVTVLL